MSAPHTCGVCGGRTWDVNERGVGLCCHAALDRISAALKEYHESVHSEKGKLIFSWLGRDDLPPIPEPGSYEMQRTLAACALEEHADAVYDFARKVANPHNWKAQNQEGALLLWNAHPPLHVTARRMLAKLLEEA